VAGVCPRYNEDGGYVLDYDAFSLRLAIKNLKKI
jgi:hypothetical protein